MTSNELVSRQASPSSAPVAMQQETDVLMVRAKMIANSGDLVPKQYQNNPGACYLLCEWSERHQVSTLEAMAEVSFNRGRASVGARMQRKLASRLGFRTQKVEGDKSSCTVAVLDPTGKEVGRSTYTYELAERLGIIYGKDGRTLKPTWAGDPAQMLYHRATTRALDHYGPSDYTTAFVESDSLDEYDNGTASNSDSEAIEAEVVSDTPEPAPQVDSEPTPPSEDELRALAKQHKLTLTQVLKKAQQLYPDEGLTTMEALAAWPVAAFDLEDWIRQQ